MQLRVMKNICHVSFAGGITVFVKSPLVCKKQCYRFLLFVRCVRAEKWHAGPNEFFSPPPPPLHPTLPLAFNVSVPIPSERDYNDSAPLSHPFPSHILLCVRLCLSVCLSLCLSVRPSVPVRLSVCLSVCLSVSLSLLSLIHISEPTRPP